MIAPEVRRQSQTLAGRVRNIANLNRPHIDIALNVDSQREGAYIHTFSTFDKIEGVAYITPATDTRFENLDISFIGNVKSVVDKLATASAVNSTSEAFQQFLKLSQPIDSDSFPSPRVLQAGRTYQFPFTFVVPEQLLPNACRHKTTCRKLKDAHLLLPPSLGDPEMSGYGSTLLDDLAPTATRVSYGIRVQLVRNRERDEKEIVISERTKRIRVVPATEELPPLTIDPREQEYCLSAEKSIRKSVFKGKIGRMGMSSNQPHSLRLPPPSSSAPEDVTTTLAVTLRFDPADASIAPPKLGALSSKLRAVTYWAARPQTRFPSRLDISSNMIASMYEHSIPLSSRCMAGTQWLRHESGDSYGAPVDTAYRRDSALSMQFDGHDLPAPTSAYKSGLPFYTARLVVPVALPKEKAFVPTFYSCLVSRVYTLETSISISPQSSTALATSIQLRIPVQVSSDTNATAGRRPSAGNIVPVANPEDVFFRPRRISPPLEQGEWSANAPDDTLIPEDEIGQMEGGDGSAPPEYSAFPSARLNSGRVSTTLPAILPNSLYAMIHAR